MKTDRSLGVIALRKVSSGVQVLLLCHVNGDHWGFAKGHPEKGESERQAAIRELKEETGLEIDQFIKDTTFEQRYTFELAGDSIDKRVLYFVAYVKAGQVRVQEAEIKQALWVSPSELVSYAKFDTARTLFNSVSLFLQSVK